MFKEAMIDLLKALKYKEKEEDKNNKFYYDHIYKMQ